MPYAKAIVNDNEHTHLCQPGGKAVYKQIQTLLNQPTNDDALNTIKNYDPLPHTVSIDLDQCIGCTKCLPACPVDAIVGAPKAMHHVIEASCTGCDLCIPTCPVDCIKIKPGHKLPPKAFLNSQYKQKKARHEAKLLNQKAKLDKVITSIESKSSNVLAAALDRAKRKRQQHEQK